METLRVTMGKLADAWGQFPKRGPGEVSLAPRSHPIPKEAFSVCVHTLSVAESLQQSLNSALLAVCTKSFGTVFSRMHRPALSMSSLVTDIEIKVLFSANLFWVSCP